MNLGIVIKRIDKFEELFLGCFRRKAMGIRCDSYPFAGKSLITYIDLRCRVLSDQDNIEPRCYAFRHKLFNVGLHLILHL